MTIRELSLCWFVIVFSSSMVSAQSIKGTSVVIHYHPDEVVIAADSFTMRDGSGVSTPFCKIRNSGNTWFAAAGQFNINATDYDVFATLADAIRREDNFDRRVSRAEREVIRTLGEAIARRTDLTLPQARKSIVAFALIELENDILKVSVRSVGFATARNDSFSVFRQDLPGENECSGGCLIPLGERKAIEDLGQERMKRVLRLGPVEAARFLVSLETIETDKVGPPIDLLRIRRDGRGIWIAKKPECN